MAETTPETSRIFVRNLPPSFSEDEFRKHFSKLSAPTDVRFFGPRRIGYVGFKSAADAASAVKYFDKSFIRMSKINVELARPISEKPEPKSRSHDITAHQSHHRPIARLEETQQSRESLKRKREPKSTNDAKLQEYLEIMQAPTKSKKWETSDTAASLENKPHDGLVEPSLPQDGDSDEEYQVVRKKNRKGAKDTLDTEMANMTSVPQSDQPGDVTAKSDADWLKSKTKNSGQTSPVNHEMDDIRSELQGRQISPLQEHSTKHTDGDSQQSNLDDAGESNDVDAPDADAEAVRASRRLFVRNLPYDATEADLEDHFSPYGRLEEVHIAVDRNTGKAKGFAFVEYFDGDSALSAFRATDSQIFQGRLMHVIPAAAKRENKLDDIALSKLPLKTQKLIQKKAQASSQRFNWNALYMNSDAVISSIAARLGVDKSEVLDPTSSDAAVKQALAETHTIQETKNYFATNGIDLETFRSKKRGDTAILVKNFPYTTKAEELKEMFGEFGKVVRFLMPPAGTIAIVEFLVAAEARTAFKALAYRRIKDSMLFLEWAPQHLFTTSATTTSASTDLSVQPVQPEAGAQAKATVQDLLREEPAEQIIETTTLFVKNLSFATTTTRLTEIFSSLEGFLTARVKTKTDPKKPGQVLSMGFGFLEFASRENAQTAVAAMNGYTLDGHKLDIRASQRALDAAEERRKEDRAKAVASQRTKIVIKNLPFQATKKEVRALFQAYGQLRSVRVPKKFDSSSRGFAFAEFTTPREAANAVQALRNTHLLGRKLVLDFAEQEPEDAEAEIERMQKKAGAQVDKVALQKLTGSSRKKFNIDATGQTQEDV